MKPDEKLINQIAQDIADALDKHEDKGLSPERLASHQLESLNMVIAAMLIEFGVPLMVAQLALERTYKHVLGRNGDEALH